MTDLLRTFLDESTRALSADCQKIERSLEGLTDADVWWRPNEASNSIGNMILHLCGNVSQWILDGVGGRPYDRDRDREFGERRAVPVAELRHQLRATVDAATNVIANVSADGLAARRRIQERDVTVLEAIYRVVAHFEMHTGQVIYVSKMRRGRGLES